MAKPNSILFWWTVVGFQVHPAIASPRTLKKTRYSKGEQRITKPTTSNGCITNWCTLDNVGTFVPNNNPTLICLIKHTQEHMEGGNRLRTDVVRCLTPSPRITKSLNLFLVQGMIMACLQHLNKIKKSMRWVWHNYNTQSKWQVWLWHNYNI